MAPFREPEISQTEMAAAEDPMELSSELNPSANAEDIDVDLSINDLTQDREDDFMAEDVKSVTDQELPDIEVLQAGNDDEMLDDEYPSEDFQENFSVNDEELEDAEESVIDDVDIVISTFEESTAKQSVRRQDEVDDSHANTEAHENGLQHLERTQEPTLQTDAGDNHKWANANTPVTNSRSNNLPEVLEDAQVAPNNNNGAVEGSDNQKPKDSVETLSTHADEQESFELPPKTEDTTSNPNHTLASDTNLPQEPSYIHPVVVVYQDNEMSLFPPVDRDQEHSQTYFLHDETYAAGSINNLLGACRSVLGESISEQDELEIHITELGLHVSESAPESYTTTLAEILDIYVQLQHYDGLENPRPLYIALRTKIMFSHRMNYLINAVAEGRGFSQLSLLEQLDEDDPQSEGSEKQDVIGEDNLYNTDGSIYADVEGNQPVDIEDTEGEKEEYKGDGNHAIARNTLDDLEESAPNGELPNADPQTRSTHLGDESKATQPSGTTGGDSTVDEAGGNEEQFLRPKVEETVIISSATSADERALQENKGTAVEEENLINYEDEEGEDGPNHEFSTSSSTIQGDSIEALKFDLAAATQNVSDNESADSGNEQLQEEGHQHGPVRQEQITDGAGGVFDANEGEEGAYNEGLGTDDSDPLELDQQVEVFHPEFDEQNKHSHEQLGNTSPDDRNELDTLDKENHDEDLPAEKRSVPPQNLTKGYKGPLNPEELVGNEPSTKHRGRDGQEALNGHENSQENAFEFAVHDVNSGELSTDTLKANRILNSGYERGSDYTRPTSTHHTTADQEHYEEPDADLDEDNIALSALPDEQSANPSPTSLKRTRTDDEDIPLDDDLQDLKRIRSS